MGSHQKEMAKRQAQHHDRTLSMPVHALMESVKETKTQHTWASPPPYVSF